MPNEINHGLIDKPHSNKDWFFGGVSGIASHAVLQADGQWDAFMPDMEVQYNAKDDFYACVTFGELNGIEFLFRRLFNLSVNFSDRFIAKMSGTTRAGNGMLDVADCIRKVGLVIETLWPMGSGMTWEDYYASVPQYVIDEAAKFLEQWALNFEFVSCDPDSMMEALKYSPVVVSIGEHIEVVYGYVKGQQWKLFDSYLGLKTKPWDFQFRGANIWTVAKKTINPNPMYQFKEGYRYFVKGKHGYTLFFLAGMLRKDDLTKCLDQWIGRNDGDIKGKNMTITPAQLVGVHLYDLDGKDLGVAVSETEDHSADLIS